MTAWELENAARYAAQAADLGAPASALNGFRAGEYIGAIRHRASGRVERLRGATFTTRELAEQHAADMIERRRIRLARDLCRPDLGHVRIAYGLPREVDE